MSTVRIAALGSSVLALIGLGLSLLPVLTITASSRLLMSADDALWDAVVFGTGSSAVENWDDICREYKERCPDVGAKLELSAFDMISSGYLVAAIVPFALALTAAITAVLAIRATDFRAWVGAAGVSLSALVVLVFTLIKPSAALSGSGSFSDLASLDSGGDSDDVAMDIGSGLYLPAIALAGVLAVTAWQAFVGYRSQRAIAWGGARR